MRTFADLDWKGWFVFASIICSFLIMIFDVTTPDMVMCFEVGGHTCFAESGRLTASTQITLLNPSTGIAVLGHRHPDSEGGSGGLLQQWGMVTSRWGRRLGLFLWKNPFSSQRISSSSRSLFLMTKIFYLFPVFVRYQ